MSMYVFRPPSVFYRMLSSLKVATTSRNGRTHFVQAVKNITQHLFNLNGSPEEVKIRAAWLLDRDRFICKDEHRHVSTFPASFLRLVAFF
jgi:hypothetical protein